MTNREKIMAEINAMDDEQLADLLLGSEYSNTIANEVCGDCEAELGPCTYENVDDTCQLSEANWMRKPCRRERLLVKEA